MERRKNCVCVGEKQKERDKAGNMDDFVQVGGQEAF